MAALVALTQHLEGARYTQFWQAVDMCRDTLKCGADPLTCVLCRSLCKPGCICQCPCHAQRSLHEPLCSSLA